MRLYDGGAILTIIIVIIAATVGIASAKITKKDDGFIEEKAEEIIKDQLGLDIDLTPSSPEK